MHQVIKIPQDINEIEGKVAQQHPAVSVAEDAQQVAQLGVQRPHSAHRLGDFGLGPCVGGGGDKSGGQPLAETIQRVESRPQIAEKEVRRGEDRELREARDLEEIFHRGEQVQPRRRPQPY